MSSKSTKLSSSFLASTREISQISYIGLYSLRVLRRAGVEQRNILKVYLTTDQNLSERLESIQGRALRLIFPSIDSFNEVYTLRSGQNYTVLFENTIKINAEL